VTAESSRPPIGADHESAPHAAEEALDGLQRSALEAIDAARGVLDAAELLLRDPAVATEVLGALATLGRSAVQMLARQAGTPATAQDEAPSADGSA
jgi:hypothetical protein